MWVLGAVRRVLDGARAGRPLPGRAVVRVYQQAGVPGRPDVRTPPPARHGQHARVPVWADGRAHGHRPARARQLLGVAGRGVLRAVRRRPAPGPATDALRGAVRPAGPRTAVDRVRGHRLVRPLSGHRPPLRQTVFRRGRQERHRGHGPEDPERNARRTVEFRYIPPARRLHTHT